MRAASNPKDLFPRARSTNYKQHVVRALFFLAGLLFHALPRCLEYLSNRGALEHFMIRQDAFSPTGKFARNLSGHGYPVYVANSISNASHQISLPSTGFSETTNQSSCPIFSLSLSLVASSISSSLLSWWASSVRFIGELTPISHWTMTFSTIAVAISYKVVSHVVSGFRLHRFSQLNACLPVKIMPNPFPWKLRRYFELSKLDANLLDEYLFKKYEQNGLTHGLGTVMTKRVKAISTIESENFKAVLATSFDDWERPAFRARAIRPFLKTGILTLVSYIFTRLL
jgi:hypothetical protein